MTLRWRFMTSSYLSTFLRDLEVLRLDLRLGRSMALVTILASIGTSSGMLNRVRNASTTLPLNSRIRSSSQRQVEARLARVALAAGAPAQLVVDATRLVALGAEDVQPAEAVDLLVLGGDRPSSTSRWPLATRPRTPRRPRPGDSPRCANAAVGHELRIASEHDVGAASGHVRGDRDRTPPAGLRDDLRPPARGASRSAPRGGRRVSAA